MNISPDFSVTASICVPGIKAKAQPSFAVPLCVTVIFASEIAAAACCVSTSCAGAQLASDKAAGDRIRAVLER